VVGSVFELDLVALRRAVNDDVEHALLEVPFLEPHLFLLVGLSAAMAARKFADLVLSLLAASQGLYVMLFGFLRDRAEKADTSGIEIELQPVPETKSPVMCDWAPCYGQLNTLLRRITGKPEFCPRKPL